MFFDSDLDVESVSSDRGVKSGPLCTVTLVSFLCCFCLGFPGHAPFTAPFTSLYRSLYRHGYRSLYLVSTKVRSCAARSRGEAPGGQCPEPRGEAPCGEGRGRALAGDHCRLR